MRIVIDSNIIIAAMIKSDSVIRKILSCENFEFYSPSFSLIEVSGYKDYILKKANITEGEFIEILDSIIANLVIINDDTMNLELDYALGIMKKFDIYDAPILATALVVNADFIWADDKHLKMQNIVPVLTTKEILRLVNP